MTGRVLRLFHPDLLVPSLDGIEHWFERVFGRESVRLEGTEWAAKMKQNRPDASTDYCTFTSLAEVLIESIEPERQVYQGVQAYPSVSTPQLADLAWYVDGLDEVYAELMRRGIRIERHHGSDPDVVPPRARFSDLVLFWTNADDTGLRYELYDPRGGNMDLRKFPGWTPLRYLAPQQAGDPLGLVNCAHHTVLTDRPERALQFVVDILGGSIIHEGPSRVIAGHSTYVALGDGVIEYATPTVADSPERAVLNGSAPHDHYYAMTFTVTDIERAAQHLASVGVSFARTTPDTLVTKVDSASGVPWGFTQTMVPGDVRALPDHTP